jgi:hypothetical protein
MEEVVCVFLCGLLEHVFQPNPPYAVLEGKYCYSSRKKAAVTPYFFIKY